MAEDFTEEESRDELSSLFSDPSALLSDKIKALKEMSQKKKGLKNRLAEITTEFESAQNEVFIMMENEGVPKIGTEDGKTAYRRLDQYYSIKKEKDGVAKDWLIENGFDHLIKETVNGRSLTSEMKKHIEEGGEIEEDLFNLATKKRIGGL